MSESHIVADIRTKKQKYMAAYRTKFCSRCKKERTPDDGKNGAYCRPCFAEYKREWYLVNRVKESARVAAYNKRKPEIAAKNMRALRAKYPEKYRAQLTEWKKKNPEKVAINDANKRAKRRGAKGSHTLSEWNDLLKIWGMKCAYCGEVKPLTKDHMNPIVRGGDNFISNIVPSCFSCNSRKGKKTVAEFFTWLDVCKIQKQKL